MVQASRAGRTGAARKADLSDFYETPTLLHLLKAGRWEAAEQKLADVFAAWRRNDEPVSRELLLEVYCMCCMSYSYVLRQQGASGDAVLDRLTGGMTRASADVKALEAWAVRMLHTLREREGKEGAASRAGIVADVQRIVQQRLHEDLSLQELSDQVHLHPKYLSWLYKQETGEGLTDYINGLRMERAVDWLKHSEMKVYEIAGRLGYQNPSYFIRVFKGKFQMTPQQYRDRLGSKS